jgi:hypothetical protein
VTFTETEICHKLQIVKKTLHFVGFPNIVTAIRPENMRYEERAARTGNIINAGRDVVAKTEKKK